MSKRGYYGQHGGQYVPDMLLGALEELEKTFDSYKDDEDFKKELEEVHTSYIGRPSPLYFAKNLTESLGGGKVYLKLESHNHTGAHKINNVFGQILLAKRMGKKKIVAETGAGQHGLATATACAKYGMECVVFMGEKDVKRQYPNVYSMKLMGARVVAVTEGGRTLKDAVSQALKYWIENVEDTYYLLGSALGPHPYPEIVSHFQSIIGREAKQQMILKEGRLPNVVVACVGGGSNALGIFTEFLSHSEVKMVGVEAGGLSDALGEHASRFLNQPKMGISQGFKSYFLQNEEGQIADTHSVSAGLDYAGISPILSELYETKRVQFYSVSDEEALTAFKTLCRKEGIIPALESSHGLAQAMTLAKTMKNDEIILVNISGRGDKDVFITAPILDRENWLQYLKEEVQK